MCHANMPLGSHDIVVDRDRRRKEGWIHAIALYYNITKRREKEE